MLLARDKLIIALDVDSAERAVELFDSLRDIAGMFKIGMQLFTAAGPDIVRRIVRKGGRVFLDLKYHDIPNTVALAGVEATRLGVSIFNIHASGGAEMMKRTAEAVAETAEREKLPAPRVLAVTLLTSIDRSVLVQLGISDDAGTVVPRLARLAAANGLDGVVASALEIESIRAVTKPDFLVITPGIRSLSDDQDDQRRTLSAGAAVSQGADYVVVGRPILDNADPPAAAARIVTEIETTLQGLKS